MKKIFTFLFAVGLITMVQAQPGTRDNRQTRDRNGQSTDRHDIPSKDQRNYDPDYDDDDYGYANNRNPATYDRNRNDRYESRFAAERRMKMQIVEINRDYDHKIEHVRDNYRMFRYEKQRQIHELNHQREYEISKVIARFNKKFGYNDHHDHKNKSKGRF